MKRTITMTIAPEFFAATGKTPRKAIDDATGYLARWGINPDSSGEQWVTLFCQADGSMSADYWRIDPNAPDFATQKGKPAERSCFMTLFGLLAGDKQSYSFHS